MDLSVLDGRTQLQHLALGLMIADAQVAQLLSHLRHMQQLTYLNLSDSMSTDEDGDDNPPAIAYAALTASSKLAHLDISWCRLPADAWKHMLSAGRQLPHLHYLSIENLDQPSGDEGIPPRGSSLVRCCPNLQSLDLRDMRCSVKLLAALPRLTRLSSLRLAHSECKGKGLEVLSQLTGLQELHAQFPFSTQQGLLLQLTQLKQLTQLVYEGRLDGAFKSARFSNQAPGDEPVWRQVLQLHLDHSDPAVAQQAAAALAE